eukprot:352796-Chlamydomonas_euryale.AAC.1
MGSTRTAATCVSADGKYMYSSHLCECRWEVHVQQPPVWYHTSAGSFVSVHASVARSERTWRGWCVCEHGQTSRMLHARCGRGARADVTGVAWAERVGVPMHLSQPLCMATSQ